jgi:predicted PurR-regulated permease PerM
MVRNGRRTVPQRRWVHMRYRKVIFYVILALLVAAAIFFIYRYRVKIARILSPFFVTVILVYIVKPLSDRLTAKKIPTGVSVLLVYLFIFAVLAASGFYFIPELAANIRELMETLPQLMSSYESIFNDLISTVYTSNWSEQVKEAVFEQIAGITVQIEDWLVKLLEDGLKLAMDMVRIIVDVTLALVISFYVIRDGEKFRDQALHLLPRRWRNGLADTFREISRILAGFIQSQLLIAFIVGILETLGLALIGMRYPLALGMLGGLANIIPYFGPYIGAIPAVAVALTISPMKAVWTVLVFIIVQQIDNNFISPKMMENRLGLHPVATIFAVLAGGEFFGIPGMLLAVPVIAILRVIINRTIEAIV